MSEIEEERYLINGGVEPTFFFRKKIFRSAEPKTNGEFIIKSTNIDSNKKYTSFFFYTYMYTQT